MSERTITVELEGESHEVALPDDVLTKDEVGERYMPKTAFEEELDRRVKSATRGMTKRDDLLDDEEFVSQVAKRHRDRLIEELEVKPAKEPDLEKIRTQVMETEVQPLKEKLEGREQEVGKLRRRDLKRQVLEAADRLGMVEDDLDLVDLWVERQVDWHPDHADWFVADGDGFAYSGSPENGRPPFKDVGELLADLKRSGNKKHWFKAEQRGGMGYRGGDRFETTSLDEFEKMSGSDRKKLKANNPELYKRMMSEKRRRGEEKLYEGQI